MKELKTTPELSSGVAIKNLVGKEVVKVKKRLLSIVLSLCLVTSLFTGCDDEEDYVEENTVASQSEGNAKEDSAEDDTSDNDKISNDDENEDEDEYEYEDFLSAFIGGLFDSSDYYESDLSSVSGGTSNHTENLENTNADEEKDAKSFTLMVYMCGSNLESDDGAATADLTEMMYGEVGNNLNIIIETGGAKEWQNSVVSPKTLQRYRLTSNGLDLLEDIGKGQITSKAQLEDFIKFSTKKYPADRYGFIFWDHGGGTIGGYGGDENYNDEGMEINQIQEAFKKAGTHFDFIGFDCCLMATVEIAKALSDSADFLIASEETEPGTGWYYTDFVTLIEKNPGASMRTIGKQIIDDYTENSSPTDDLTLALIDLSEVDTVLDSLHGSLQNSNDYLINNGYGDLARARNGARSYGNNDFEQIDIIDYVSRTDIQGGDELEKAIQHAVIYNGTNMVGSNGMAMYYPYLHMEAFPQISQITTNVGISDNQYMEYFSNFVSVEYAGSQNGGNSNPYSSDETAGDDYEDIFSEFWFNDELTEEYSDNYSYVDSDELEITQYGDDFVLELSDEDWEIITNIELEVYIDDGEGFLSLGADDSYNVDDDGNLMVEFDYYWFYLNDSIVPYTPVSSGEYIDGRGYWYGKITAELNDSDVIDIWVYWEEDADPVILGYTNYIEEATVAPRGYNKFKNGDKLAFLFDYYDYDGNYEDSYILEDNDLIFDKSTGLTLEYGELSEEYDTQILFHIKDIYQNDYYTEPLSYTSE